MPAIPGPPLQPIVYRSGLSAPVVGMEAEFSVVVDGREVPPEEIWSAPTDFVRQKVLKRATRASQLATGGAIYFDKGVIELVTPVFEIEPGSTSRMVRSMWEQVALVRSELDRWSAEKGVDVRLRGFSAHYNVSFEVPREERGRDRTVQKLALLLAHILPVPVIVAAANRRSTGVGVRPRRDRIEVTVDFTPDPGLMLATAALIAGVVRGVIPWPSYRTDELRSRGIPMLRGYEPGKHTTRKGWLARAAQFEADPFQRPLDSQEWHTDDGRPIAFRALALQLAEPFRESIRLVSDRFSEAVLFGLLEGRVPALLDADDRPSAYDDVGDAARWGRSIPLVDRYAALAENPAEHRRQADMIELGAPWTKVDADRRQTEARETGQRRRDRRAETDDVPALSRSAYENVFIRLVTCDSFVFAGRTLRPVRIEGWYHVDCTDAASGEEVLVPIEELVRANVEWR